MVTLNAPESVRGTYTELIALDAPREPVILNGGALIGRTGIASKRGLEKVHAQRLMELGCPILYTVHGKGSVFESGNVVWIDEKHIMIGCGLRTSREAIDEVEPVLRMAGIEEIHVAHLPGYLNHWTERAGGAGGFYHLDMVFSMVDEGLGVIYPAGVGYDTIRYLKQKNIDLIEVPLDEVRKLCLQPTRDRAGQGHHHGRKSAHPRAD